VTSESSYKKLRNQYLPKSLKTIFIFESLPTGGGYFYNPDGRPSELLFRSLMKCLFGKKFNTKHDGLTCFANSGYFLVDPIYIPVDKLPDKEADELILKNYSNFVDDLKGIIGDKKVNLMLAKKTVCQLLEKRLCDDGFNVLNNGVVIPFPMHYHYKSFEEKVQKLLL
jgi:hypothetical protein